MRGKLWRRLVIIYSEWHCLFHLIVLIIVEMHNIKMCSCALLIIFRLGYVSHVQFPEMKMYIHILVTSTYSCKSLCDSSHKMWPPGSQPPLTESIYIRIHEMQFDHLYHSLIGWTTRSCQTCSWQWSVSDFGKMNISINEVHRWRHLNFISTILNFSVTTQICILHL